MRTVVLGERPAELEALIARRCACGHDLFDEVWDGDYHMAPTPHDWHNDVAGQLAVVLGLRARSVGLRLRTAFNLGAPDDFRVPDLGLRAEVVDAVWLPTAAMVVEVVSPDDESWLKFDHYARHESTRC